ncbi:hypothetical protein OBBRIDRAFT_498768 [Obba rivulosa]|uniref:Uncharacterized protein n=1 Tax=Obba rivulosa TaxID=1052685 RepID=A0A8E2DTT4_9APHY|nr:hypothetical protein OBBRIDRAFT_498768 [Obba rivulosa]
MSTRPRPILKRESPLIEPTLIALPFAACPTILSPHVHFPPTPRISSQHPAHSPRTYDRAPIVVSPNVCQLPQRGARTLYSPPTHFEVEKRGRSRSRGPDVKGSYFHPRAYEACKPEPLGDAPPSLDTSMPMPPSLVQDLSPSDESDESVTTPPDSMAVAAVSASLLLPFCYNHKSESFAVQAHSATDSAHSLSLSHHRKLAEGKRKQQRPGLARMDDRKLGGGSLVTWDEGCLGGF